MSDKRMAGEKLDEPTKASADAKEALSQSERNKQIREEIGNDPERLAERISGVDREKYDFTGYSDKEINMALQGDSFGDKDYARLTGNLGDGGDGGGKDPKPGNPQEPDVKIPTPVPPTTGQDPDQWFQPPGGAPGVDGANQNVQQDNDMVTNITGDGNTFNGQQDNSVGQYLGGYMRKHNFFK